MNGKENLSIIIRADGNETIGLGHLMRCMSIAREVEKQGAQCIFVVAEEQAGILIREKGFHCEVLGTNYRDMEAELPHILNLTEKYSPKLWLVDSYYITDEYVRALKESGPVFYLDDMGNQLTWADGLINYNIYGEELGYKASPYRQLLLGPEYAPVKEEFRKTPYEIKNRVEKVLITMGGSDKLNITGKLCECLLERLEKSIKLTLVSGRFNPHLQELRMLEEKNNRIQVLVDVPDMWNKLAQADIVVAAAGSTMYELSAMGVPTVCCYYVENQKRIAEGFEAKVGLCNGGDFSKEPEMVLERMADAVCKLVENRETRESMSLRLKKVSDGKGSQRIAQKKGNNVYEESFRDFGLPKKTYKTRVVYCFLCHSAFGHYDSYAYYASGYSQS